MENNTGMSSDIKMALTLQKLGDQIGVIENVHLPQIKETLSKIEQQLEDDYVSRSEFMPVQRIVYGMVGIILVAVLGALITLVLR
jgi:hypothetical protein